MSSILTKIQRKYHNILRKIAYSDAIFYENYTCMSQLYSVEVLEVEMRSLLLFSAPSVELCCGVFLGSCCHLTRNTDTTATPSRPPSRKVRPLNLVIITAG